MCYGVNLANQGPAKVGDSVGVMAAQSIGEPGTQLTLRTFHIGGTASRIVEESQRISRSEGKIIFSDRTVSGTFNRARDLWIGNCGNL